MLTQTELSSREQLVLETDALLAEATRRFSALAAALAAQQQQQQPRQQHPPATPTTPADRSQSQPLTPAARLHTRSRGSAGATLLAMSAVQAAGRKAAAAGPPGAQQQPGVAMMQQQQLLQKHCEAMVAWCAEAAGRISR